MPRSGSLDTRRRDALRHRAVSATVATLMVSAAASGQGKTTVTAALARHALRNGRRVRVFKTGPDFIDPMILERAAGSPVGQIDLWMGGAEHCRELLCRAAQDADLLLVEGVMGLYDGEPSSADLALLFNLPVLLVIDAAAMAGTFGALALGLQAYRPELPLYGVLANQVGGPGHAAMLANSLSGPAANIRLIGALERDASMALPERHLGLVQAGEVRDLDARIDRAASALGTVLSLEDIPHITFTDVSRDSVPKLLAGMRIAVAQDAAFSFTYGANLELLSEMGAVLVRFSPLRDPSVPDADAIYLPGGYPELHAAQLAANSGLHEGLRRHVQRGAPLVAECGGMMLLFESLSDLDGRRHAMAAVLPGRTVMQERLQALALQSVTFPQGELRGHAFHHSCLETPLGAAWRGRTQHGGPGEAVFREGAVTASYIHFYWPSNPRAAAALFLP